MSKLVLISFNELNKVVKVPPSVSESNEVKFLRQECLKMFKFGTNVCVDLVFQRYDEEWDAWVDLEDDFSFAMKEKLKMVVQPTLNDTVSLGGKSSMRQWRRKMFLDGGAPSYRKSRVSSKNSSQTNIGLKVAALLEEKSDEFSFSISAPTSPIVSDSEDNPISAKKRKRSGFLDDEDKDETCSAADTDIIGSGASTSTCSAYKKFKVELPEAVKKRGHEKSLPFPFPLPSNYRPEVELCLKDAKMTAVARKHFLSSVASAIFSYKRYPTKEEFTHVALEVINKYPCMKAKSGSPTGAIVQALINRFKEFRRCKGGPSSSKKSAKGAAATATGATPASAPTTCARKACSPGATLVPPPVPSGEDDVSFSRHNKEIKSLMTKKRLQKNLMALNHLIKLSYAMRRNDILSNEYHVKIILEKYPFFKEPNQLYKEAERICGEEQLRSLVRDAWANVWSQRIIDQAELEMTTNARLREFMSTVHNPNAGIYALCLLPYMIRDPRCKPDHEKLAIIVHESCDINEVVSEKDQNEPYLFILGSFQEPIQVFVVVDQEVLCEVELLDSPFALMAAFFAFNICYTKNLSYVFTFLETILLKLSPKLSPTVTNFLSALGDAS